jgi:hypothetical protein
MDSSIETRRTNRKHLTAFLATLLLLLMLLVVGMACLVRRSNSPAAYDAVQDGMTVQEVWAVLNPGVMCVMESMDRPIIDLETLCPENFPLPPSRIMLKFEDGLLTEKDRVRPSVGCVLISCPSNRLGP